RLRPGTIQIHRQPRHLLPVRLRPGLPHLPGPGPPVLRPQRPRLPTVQTIRPTHRQRRPRTTRHPHRPHPDLHRLVPTLHHLLPIRLLQNPSHLHRRSSPHRRRRPLQTVLPRHAAHGQTRPHLRGHLQPHRPMGPIPPTPLPHPRRRRHRIPLATHPRHRLHL